MTHAIITVYSEMGKIRMLVDSGSNVSLLGVEAQKWIGKLGPTDIETRGLTGCIQPKGIWR